MTLSAGDSPPVPPSAEPFFNDKMSEAMNAAFPIREGSVGQTPCSRRDNRIACMSQLVLHDGYMARAEAASDLTDRAGEGMRSMWSAKADRARGRKLGLGQFNMGRKRVADKLAMKHARGYGAHTNNEGEGRGDRGEGESESDSEGDVDSDVERLERCGDAPSVHRCRQRHQVSRM